MIGENSTPYLKIDSPVDLQSTASAVVGCFFLILSLVFSFLQIWENWESDGRQKFLSEF